MQNGFLTGREERHPLTLDRKSLTGGLGALLGFSHEGRWSPSMQNGARGEVPYILKVGLRLRSGCLTAWKSRTKFGQSVSSAGKSEVWPYAG